MHVESDDIWCNSELCYIYSDEYGDLIDVINPLALDCDREICTYGAPTPVVSEWEKPQAPIVDDPWNTP